MRKLGSLNLTQQVTELIIMIIKDKVTEIYCIINKFDKNFDLDLNKNLLPATDGKKLRNRKVSLSDSKIMTILLHFGTYRNLKQYNFYCIPKHIKHDLPNVVYSGLKTTALILKLIPN